ncbi:hypothetical protein H4R19_001146 [Coemansia spiralis]|nr:hypothetical protein H4R19_001146 [Coemansia spiralis]
MEQDPYAHGHGGMPPAPQQAPHDYYPYEQPGAPGPSLYPQGGGGWSEFASMAYNRPPGGMHQPYYPHSSHQYFAPSPPLRQNSATGGLPGPMQAKRENTIYNCVADGLLQSLRDGVTPVIVSMVLSSLHHFKNRKAAVLTPYSDAKYSRYRDNLLFCLASYQFLRVNGVSNLKVNPKPAEKTPGPGSVRSRGIGAQDHNDKQDKQDGRASDIDEYWVVPRDEAAHHYMMLYSRRAGLADAGARELGAAAAVWALNSRRNAPPADGGGTAEQLVMERALDEAEALLAHKAAVTALGPDDNIDIVGRYALATVIDALVVR